MTIHLELPQWLTWFILGFMCCPLLVWLWLFIYHRLLPCRFKWYSTVTPGDVAHASKHERWTFAGIGGRRFIAGWAWYREP